MDYDVINNAFLIKIKNIYNNKKRSNPNDPVTFFVADLVGPHDWEYPFDTVYDAYYDPNRPSVTNWQASRTQIGRIFARSLPWIESKIGMQITPFQSHRKGHLINCYRIEDDLLKEKENTVNEAYIRQQLSMLGTQKIVVVTQTENLDGTKTQDHEYLVDDILVGGSVCQILITTRKVVKGVENALNLEIGRKWETSIPTAN
jgi:hypothetical protein